MGRFICVIFYGRVCDWCGRGGIVDDEEICFVVMILGVEISGFVLLLLY